LIKAIDSWTREIPLADILQSPLFSVLIHALEAPESFDAAIDCLCTIIRETRDVDENQAAIEKLLPQVLTLRPKLARSAQEEDTEVFTGIARVFAEAGDSWVLLVARQPVLLKPLVESLLDTAALDWEKDSVKHTFSFWYELKQYLTLEKYLEAKKELRPIYSKLVDIMIKLLEYPAPESGNEIDLFEGDRDAEEKFREFRHQMGDVLKDCCEVLGATECLKKPYELIHAWVGKYASQAAPNRVPHWQELEAPLFALRAMGREVPPDEDVMLPQLIPLIVQIPDHPKLRFQAVMVLGRYTEWTAQHPQTLQDQLQFIIGAFNYPSKEVLQAAALSFKFFCTECADLLKGEVAQLQQFYSSVLDKLSVDSQEEITEGVAAILAKQPIDQIYPGMKAFVDPVVQGIVDLAEKATDKASQLALSDRLQLLTIFIQWVQPYVPEPNEHPAVKYCQEIFPYLASIARRFMDSIPVLERICRCWRHMVIAYRTQIAPLVPAMAEELRIGFAQSKQGCFLWATDSIVREFYDDAEGVQPGFAEAVYQFFEQQATTFLRALSEIPPEGLPDVIEDFFRMCQDILLYHSNRALPSPMMLDILEAASNTLQILKEEPLMATLHFLRDFLSYGLPDQPYSSFANGDRRTPQPVVDAVKRISIAKGEEMTKRLMVGMMYTFPQDCYPDASGVILGLFQILPQQASAWIRTTITLLPEGALTASEAQKLIGGIEQ
jgi:transportin-3